MSVTKDDVGDLTIVKVDGDLSGVNAEELRTVAQECLRDGRRDFLVDLANTNSCDSAGLEALTWLHRQCAEQLGLVKLCAMSETFEKILELTRLKNRFVDSNDTF